MKNNLFTLLTIIILVFPSCSKSEKGTRVLLKTTYGNIKVRLYDETPKHRDNFIKQVKEGKLNETSFHRVISDFMIQGGNRSTDSTLTGVAPELNFVYPRKFHKRGALGAARWESEENPDLLSDPLQFYIVTGDVFTNWSLTELEKDRLDDYKNKIFEFLKEKQKEKIEELSNNGDEDALDELASRLVDETEGLCELQKNEYNYNAEQRAYYTKYGGTPHLDNRFTVFGEVEEGMEIVDKIAAVKVNDNNTPLKKILLKIEILD